MRILVTGASGQLGSYLIHHLVMGGRHEVAGWSGTGATPRSGIPLLAVDLTNEDAVAVALTNTDPDLICHLAAMSSTDAVRREPRRGWDVNLVGTERLARWCRDHDRRLVFTSTDMVFDGERGRYREEDAPNPVLEYGRTKAAAESAARVAPRALVARISLLFGPSRSGRETFFDRALAALARSEPQFFFEDEFRTPLHLATAADLLARLAVSDLCGIVHVGGTERVSRYELMRQAANALGLDTDLVRANRRADVATAEPRPADLSLDTSNLATLLSDKRRPTIEESVRQHGD